MKNLDPGDKNKFCKNKNPNPGDGNPEKTFNSRDFGIAGILKFQKSGDLGCQKIPSQINYLLRLKKFLLTQN